MTTMWHQQIFAVDARYNTLRANKLSSKGMLYIRRRNQLLREKPSRDLEIGALYLKLRSELLCRRYGERQEQNSIGSHMISEESSEKRTKYHTVQRKSTAENFAFAGVHHVFDQHKAAVTMLKFANSDRSRLCCASLDGTLSICEVISTSKVIALLEGHRNGVTALDWSISNDLIVSFSLDTTIRLWRVCADTRPSCLRAVNDQQRAEVPCCSFIPANNNLIVAGNSQGLIQVLNVSTGIYTRGGSCKIGAKILSLTYEGSGGSVIWAGNDRDVIVSFRLEHVIGRLKKLQRVQETGGMETSFSWRSCLSKDASWSTLLVSLACNAVLLYRVADSRSSLCFWRKYPVKHRYIALSRQAHIFISFFSFMFHKYDVLNIQGVPYGTLLSASIRSMLPRPLGRLFWDTLYIYMHTFIFKICTIYYTHVRVCAWYILYYIARLLQSSRVFEISRLIESIG